MGIRRQRLIDLLERIARHGQFAPERFELSRSYLDALLGPMVLLGAVSRRDEYWIAGPYLDPCLEMARQMESDEDRDFEVWPDETSPGDGGGNRPPRTVGDDPDGRGGRGLYEIVGHPTLFALGEADFQRLLEDAVTLQPPP